MKRFMTMLGCALLAYGCGSDEATTPAAGGTGEPTAKVGFRFSTGKFTIQPGDTFECFYTDTITDRQLNVNAATGFQGPGGHHMTVYYTDQKVPVGHHTCSDQEMVGLHQVAGAAEGKEGVIGLPEGYATKVPQNKQLVVQSHYIRTETTPLEVEDVVDLHTLETEEVVQFANAFVMLDTTFKLEPRSKKKSVTDCVLPRDFDMLLMLGHMHEWGQHYKLERVDDTGKPLELIYETDWDPVYASHPPVNSYDPKTPLHFAKGTRIRQTCEWNNVEDYDMAFPREMCVMFSYYIPDDGFKICDTEKAVGQ
jgi:hypothetical protein